METIYKTPEGDVGVNEKFRPHGFWRFFFWVHVVIASLLVFVLFFVANLSIYDYIDMSNFIVQAIMVFGYAYSKRIFTKLFWKAYFIFYVVWTVAYGFVMPFGFNVPQYGEQVVFDIWFLIDPMFYILSITALYFYVYKSQEVWCK